MKQWKVLLAFFLLNLLKTLTSGLPYQHLVIFESEGMVLPKETVVATQLQVSPRADGTGDYKFKEVPLISRKRGKEVITDEETSDESKQEIENHNENEESELEETEIWKGEDKVEDHEKITEEIKIMHTADAATKEAVKDIDENTKSLGDFEAGPQKINSHKVKQPAAVDAINPIYITIPIYLNSTPGLPLALAIGNEQMPLTANRQGVASRRGALPKETSPTSQYNKLL